MDKSLRIQKSESISRERSIVEEIHTGRTSMKDIKFLNDNQKLDRVAYASYPRSGNSFMRNNFEQITGIYTGGTMGESMELDKPLKEAGLAGEYERGDKVWIVYSHYPILSEYDFNVKRIILGVRNPFDVMDSFFNLLMTKSQNKSLAEEEYIKHQEVFKKFVIDSTQEWKNFYQFWLDQNFPIFIVRYEDLLFQREEYLTQIFKFLYKSNELGLCTTQIIKDLISSTEKRVIYKPRKAQINYGMEKYSDELKQYMMNELGDLLVKFGYPEGIYQEENSSFVNDRNQRSMQTEITLLNQEDSIEIDDKTLYVKKDLLKDEVFESVKAFDKLCFDMMNTYHRNVKILD